MSTKLYEGLRVSNPHLDIFDVTQQVAKEITNVSTEISMKHVLSTMTNIHLDPTIIERTGLTASILLSSISELFEKEQQKRSPSDSLHDPFRFTIAFGKTHSGHILAYPFCFQQRYREHLASMDCFTEYGYWDNVDMPDDISLSEWQQRKDEWEFVCGDNRNFAHLPSWTLSTLHESTVINPMNILMEQVYAKREQPYAEKMSAITLSDAERRYALCTRLESLVYQKISQEKFTVTPDSYYRMYRLISDSVGGELSRKDYLHVVPVLTWNDVFSDTPTQPVDLSELDWIVDITVDAVLRELR